MFLTQLWKEIRTFFASKGNLLFTFLMPILLISVFSFALRDYIKADYKSFEDGKVFYYTNDVEPNEISEFNTIKEKLEKVTGVSFEQIYDYKKACADVEKSLGYGVITIKKDGYEYFRSTFNEPEGGKILRTLFEQLADTPVTMQENAAGDGKNEVINKTRLQVNRLDSKNYYTFAGLAFSILFMGLLVAFMVYDEKEYGTIERIRLSNAGIPAMILSKVLTGVISGIVMIVASYLFSSLVLKVRWGEHTGLIMIVLLCLVVFAAVFGCVVGLIGKNKTICQSTVLMFSMICGYLGGSITPLYLLENVPILNGIVKISPLYWTNRAISSLYNGIVDEKMVYSISILGGLVVVLTIVGINAGRKGARRI
jgi:ABC-2 type transport system permease protein